jgi:hypothetical protein
MISFNSPHFFTALYLFRGAHFCPFSRPHLFCAFSVNTALAQKSKEVAPALFSFAMVFGVLLVSLSGRCLVATFHTHFPLLRRRFTITTSLRLPIPSNYGGLENGNSIFREKQRAFELPEIPSR